MGGFFGTVSKTSCVTDLFYGTDYNSHLGTKRGGLATYSEEKGFIRSIHNLESTYFRTKFEGELDKFKGNAGIGIISDTDAQPIIINSHLGRFAIVTVAKIVNIQELEEELLSQNMHFAELSSSNTNQTELIALLIIQGRTFVEGIENVFKHIKGSCSMLLLTEDGSIIAARDRWGRTPVVIGRKDGAYAATSESSSFPNLDYEIERYLGPGEIVRMYVVANHVLPEADAPKKNDGAVQLDLFTDYAAEEKKQKAENAALERERKIQAATLAIKKKYGKNAILKAMNLEEGATAKDRNAQIGGHKA